MEALLLIQTLALVKEVVPVHMVFLHLACLLSMRIDVRAMG
jgi:hypothetical protein